ncbi:MAG: HAMP domain-containing histidine kinase [Actinobacteria bacterium]|nr:HAMP domain-containing histidine kinase [Actinomycetota bacterium]
MRSLRTTVALIVAAAVALSVVGLAIGVWFLTRSALIGSVDSSLEARLQAGIFLEPAEDAPPIVRPPIQGQPTVLVDAVLADGDVFEVDRESFDLPADAEDVRIAQSPPGTQAYSTRVAPNGAAVRVLTVAVVDGAAARAVRSLEETNTILVGLASILAVVGLAAVGVGAGIGVLAVRRSTIPLEEVADAMRALSRGEQTEPPEAKSGAPREVVDVVEATTALQDALARSQQQQEQLVQDAGHELRTPLSALRANVQFAARTATDPTTQDSLNAAQAELDELGRLVEELLALAARDEPVREEMELDIRGAIPAAAERLTRRTQREVSMRMPNGPVMLRIDPVGFTEIIGNLLDNAAKFSPAGTPIVVALTDEGHEVGIEVRDGGPGIPEAERETVFDRFHRTPDARAIQGSGLGLSIVASAVADARGTVTLGDAPEGGLLVRVTLPR